jgi:hypothetical protein
MSFSVEKKQGLLIIKDHGCYETRNPSTIWCIQKANTIYNWKDFPEITVHTGDSETDSNHYTYSKKNNLKKLVPDFNFHAWPEIGVNDYEIFIKQIDETGKAPYIFNKVGWIGNIHTNQMRSVLMQIGSNNSDLFDFFQMNWIPSGNTLLNATKYISTPDLVKRYSILIDIEGGGYSGRLKHLLWSHRPLLLVDRPHKEYFFKYLNEWEHYIPVKRDLSDLVEKTRWVMNNYDKACVIAENAFEFSKMHLTREACYKQWDLTITDFMSSQQ